MEEFLANFNEDGSFKFKIEAYFDDDTVDREVLDILTYMLDAREFDVDSDIVALYYADKYESDDCTAYSLFLRTKD